MANLWARKPLNMLLAEAGESGEHSLKRTLGPFQLTALGVGAVIGAGIFVLSGLGAHYAGPGLMLSFVLSGMGCAFAALCYAEFAAMIPLAGSAYTYAYATLGELFAWIIGWDLTLEYAMGASTVSSGWSNHFIELLDIFHIKMPLWLAYDHWTGLRAAENIVARQMAQASDSSLVPGTQAFLNRVTDIIAAQSPQLVQRAHELLDAPTIFGVEVGCNLPAFIIALVITAILAIGIKESARFNATIVVIKVAVVLFVIGLGFRYVNTSNWGGDWHSFAPMGFSGIGAGAAYIFFAYIGFDAVSTTAQEAKNPQRDLPIGIIASLLICTALYIAVAAVLTGMVPWREVNIEAPIARAFLDRGLTSASHIITLGALAGLTSVMLVMLLGPNPRPVLDGERWPAAQEILRRHSPQVAHSVEEHHSGRPFGGGGRQPDADRRHRQDGQHRHAAGLRDRVHRGDPAAPHRSGPAAALPHALGAAGADSWRHVQRLYDVPAGLDQLGPADHLAGDRVGRVFHLRPEAQQSAGAHGRRKISRWPLSFGR